MKIYSKNEITYIARSLAMLRRLATESYCTNEQGIKRLCDDTAHKIGLWNEYCSERIKLNA